MTSESTSNPYDIVVAICTYNNAPSLDRTLASLAEQEVEPSIDWSVLVIDNNSSDDTPGIVQKYIDSNRIPDLSRVFEAQQGLSHARRRAITEAKSPVIAFVDDDCILDAKWVQVAADFMMSHPNAGALGGQVTLLYETPPNELVLQYEGSLAKQDHAQQPVLLTAADGRRLVGAGLVLRRAAIFNIGWMEHSYLVGRKGNALSAGEDTEIVLRMRNVGYDLWYTPDLKLQHCIPTRRTTVDYIARLRRGMGQASPIAKTLAADRTATLAWRIELVRDALRRLRRALKKNVVDLLRKRSITAEGKIALADAWGRVEGTVWFLFRGMSTGSGK